MSLGRFLAGAFILPGLLAACSSGSSIIPNKTIYLTSRASISLASVATGAAVLGAANLIYDPLAPNWEIEETRVSEDSYRFSLKMKRYHTGGAGEALQILKRRAAQLQQEQGFASYQIMEYTEGIDSQTIGARRIADGVIRLVQAQPADSFLQN